MTDITITLSEENNKGRYVATLPGFDGEGELTYSRISPKLIIADHTGVPDSMGGKGVAKALVERLVADAREQDFKIVPLCPYVRAQYEKHPEWADLFRVK